MLPTCKYWLAVFVYHSKEQLLNTILFFVFIRNTKQMALNFGSWFEKALGADLRDIANKGAKAMGDYAVKFSGISKEMEKDIDKQIETLKELSKAYEENSKIIERNKTLAQDSTITIAQRKKLEDEQLDAEIALQKIEIQKFKTSEKLNEQAQEVTKTNKNLGKSLEDLSKLKFENVEDVTKIKSASVSRMTQAPMMKGAEVGLKTLNGSFEEIGKNSGIADVATKGLSSGLQSLGFEEEFAVKVTDLFMGGVTKAINQMTDLNDSIVAITRNSGGMVTAADLGTDAFGNISGTLTSLKTEAIGANVTVKQVGDAIEKLMTDGMGPIAGAAKMGAGDLRKYGIEAAQFAKMYNTDISGTVREMFMNFGKPIGEITKSISAASSVISDAGLSVQEFVKNLQEVANTAGDIYFKDAINGMNDFAETATRLGTNIHALMEGFDHLNTLTDLYTKQQKAAAMGMHSLGSNMTKIFTLKQGGHTEEAANVQLAAVSKDLTQFMDQNGKVSQQGIETAKSMGFDADMVKNVERLTRGAKAAGMSMERYLIPFNKMTKEEQKRFMLGKKAERQAMTLKERWDQVSKTVLQLVIDPLTKLGGLILGPLISALEYFQDLITQFPAIFTGLKVVVGAVLVPALVAMGAAIWSNVIAPMLAMGADFIAIGASMIAEFLPGVIAAGIGLLTTFVPPLIAAAAGLWTMLAPILPIVLAITAIGAAIWYFRDELMGIGKKLWAIISWPYKKLFAALKPVIDWISDKLTPVIKFFVDMWNDLKAAWNAAKKDPPLSWFYGGEEKTGPVATNFQAVQAMTNTDIANQMKNQTTPNLPSQQNINAATSIGSNAGTNVGGGTGSAGQQMTKGMETGVQPAPKITVVNKITPGVVQKTEIKNKYK